MTDTPLYPQFVKVPATLIGCGGIGSNCAPLLAKTGTPNIELWDDDHVAPVNLQMQAFDEDDVGKAKTRVVCKRLMQIRPTLEVNCHDRRFAAHDELDGVVVAGVDSMQSRSQIFESVLRNRERIPLYLDGRLSRQYPEYCELFAIDPKDSALCAEYERWIDLDADNMHHERPKTFATHTPVILAGIIGNILSRWLANERCPWRTTFNGRIPHLESYFFATS